ncbi:MAG: low specificity L-threonine aldolase [Acidobacteria bacterium]|nr:MAG: low specificity L-threonine aldolase [Acidobacteriota bacterium]
MRRAMAEAEVGDDVYGEDPTVVRLQERVAGLLGFEAGLWVPSGVMANEIAIRILTRPGQEVLAEERSHVVQFELAGMAVLSGVMPRVVRTEDGHLTAEDIRAAPRPPSYMRSDLGLVVLENTHNFAGGTVADAALMRGAIEAAHALGLPVHVDGARLWNAAIALGAPLASLVAGADTAMVTLSKGLCAPAGSVLVSTRARIEEARRVRKQLGGGMRQVGILASAGLVGVETMIDRLADDHAHARTLAAALAACPGVRVLPARTNIVVAELADRPASDVSATLAARGVLASVMDARTLRLVTHHDVDGAACARAAEILADVLGRP